MEAEKLVKTILVLSVTLVLWASPAKCDLDTGLIAYWTFDEGSGTVAYDSAGTNDGTISGAQWTEGIIGGALDFDGVDDYVRVADSHSLTPTNEVTVSAWIHIRSVSWSDRTAIVCKYYWRGDRAYFLGLGKNKDPDKTTVAFVVAETPHTIGYPRYSTTSLLPGQWYHVAATFEPNHEVIYVNSIKETDDSNLSIPDSIPNNSQPLYIGYHKDEEDGFFDGIIDEVALWQRALSAEEVEQLYLQAAAAPALTWTENLLSNPGAETGGLGHWVTDDPEIVVASQLQSESSGTVYPHSGDWFFNMAGASPAPSGVVTSRVLYQDLDVNSYSSEADAGWLLVRASTYLQTEDVPYLPGADYGQLTVYFLNEDGSEIDSLSTGLMQSPNLSWVQETLEGAAPAGTRTLRFELLGEKHERAFINAFFDDASLCVAVTGQWVGVDVKPQSCPNPLNLASRGILPVAVLGAEDFDVNAIDIASIRLEGVAPVRSNYEDVSAQVVDGNKCDCSTTGPDGYADLTLKFRTQNIVAELATQIEDLAQGDMLALSLTGTLTDGTAIEGQDCVVIVGKVPKAILAKKSDINEDGIVNNYDFAEMAKYWLEYADLPD